MNLIDLLLIWFGVSIGNYIFQYISKEKDWKMAHRISFFQAIPLILVAYLS